MGPVFWGGGKVHDSTCSVFFLDLYHPHCDRGPEVWGSVSAALFHLGSVGCACCLRGLWSVTSPPQGSRRREAGSRADCSQPASMQLAGSLHTESVTGQIIARSRKGNRNIQCQQFTKYDSRLVWEQGPNNAFSFLVSFPSAEQVIQWGLRPGEEAPRWVERALRRGVSFLPGFYCSVLETSPIGGALRWDAGSPREQGHGAALQDVSRKDHRAHQFSQI